MKQIYFITATNTNIGKTYASEVFLKKFSKMGKRVGYFKPIETGVNNIPYDGSRMFQLAQSLNEDFSVTLNDVVPYQYHLAAAPFVASGGVEIVPQNIKKQIDYLLGFCDVLIVEGAGGLMVPINKEFFMIDLIEYLKPTKTYLITPSRLGCINDTLLSINILQNKKIDFEWFVNLYEDKESFNKVTLPFYKAYFDTIRFL